MCEFGCSAFLDESTTECSQCNTARNRNDPVYLTMVSIQDKIAQMLAIPEIREDIANYRKNFKQDGVYKDVFSGKFYQELITKKGLFQNIHDVAIGLCVDAFTSKSGNQSMVMISALIFSVNPSQR
jgi:hypothetical protein